VFGSRENGGEERDGGFLGRSFFFWGCLNANLVEMEVCAISVTVIFYDERVLMLL
jgi:hypothetical protein